MEQPQQETQRIVRLDRSRDFSTVHGERRPDDPHYSVYFYQYNLPFDAAGILIADHPDIKADPRKQAAVEKLMKRAAKVVKQAPGDAIDQLLRDGEGGEDGDGEPDDTPELNLVMWARGEQKWKWQGVSDAITARFSKRVADKKGAIEALLEEKVVTLGDLSIEHRKLVA